MQSCRAWGTRTQTKGPTPRPLFLWDSLLDLPTESLSGNGRQGLIPRPSCFLSVLKHISALRFWLYGYGRKVLGSFQNTISNLRKYKLQRQNLGTQLSKHSLTHSSIHLYVHVSMDTHTTLRNHELVWAQILACKEKQATDKVYKGEPVWGQEATQSKTQMCVPSEERNPSGREKCVMSCFCLMQSNDTGQTRLKCASRTSSTACQPFSSHSQPDGVGITSCLYPSLH